MRSTAVVDIDAPVDDVAARYADPANTPKWMVDLEKYEPLSGDQGMPGSRYRLVSERFTFDARVLERKLPHTVKLVLEAPSFTVNVDVNFKALTTRTTRLESIEVFRFNGLFGRAMSLFARRAINEAHLHQMQAFKRYAERAYKGIRGLVDLHPPASDRRTSLNPPSLPPTDAR